jgi:transcription antitermination factor NusG
MQTVCRSLFVGYLFVDLQPDQRWAPISSTYGVVKLLTRAVDGSEHGYREPCVIDDALISGLQQCSREAPQHNGDDAVWLLKPGTKIKLISGPMRGNVGEVVAMKTRDRAMLLVHLLGRPLVVTVHGDSVIEIG